MRQGSAIGAGNARDAAASPCIKVFGQNWLDFGKVGWIWAILRQNLGTIEAKFGQKWFGQNQNLYIPENIRSPTVIRQETFKRVGPGTFQKWTISLCLHDQNKSGYFRGPAFIQPIRTSWKVFKKPWLAGKKPAL